MRNFHNLTPKQLAMLIYCHFNLSGKSDHYRVDVWNKADSSRRYLSAAPYSAYKAIWASLSSDERYEAVARYHSMPNMPLKAEPREAQPRAA